MENKKLKLEAKMWKKWSLLGSKYPQCNLDFLDGIHKLFDWFEKEKKKLKDE